MLVTIAASIYLQCLVTLHRSNHKSSLGWDRFEIIIHDYLIRFEIIMEEFIFVP